MTDPADLQQISGRLERGEIDSAGYLEELMRFVAAQIGCSRAALRLFVDIPAGRVLRSIAMYDADLDRMVAAPDIAQSERSAYTAQLHRDGSVVINDGAADGVTAGVLRDYLRDAGIASLMDMSCSVNGGLFGTFSCEQRGAPVEWTQRQQQALRRIASRASLTLMHLVNTAIDTTPGALWSTSTPNRLTTMPMPLDLPPAGEET